MTSPKLAEVQNWTLTIGRNIVRSLVYRLALSDEALTRRLQEHFPIEMQKYLMTLTLMDPQVQLHDHRNRIAIWVDIRLVLPGGLTARGHIETEGEVIYVHHQGAFYLSQPDITVFELRPLPSNYLKPARYMIRVMLTRFFSEHAIFRFRESSIRHRMARSIVRNVEIRRGKLRVNFHLRRDRSKSPKA